MKLKENDPGKGEELAEADTFDIQEMVELWNKHQCRVPLDRVIDVCDEIAGLFPVGIRFAMSAHSHATHPIGHVCEEALSSSAAK